MHTQVRAVSYFNPGYRAADGLVDLNPELACFRLRLGVRGPVVADMLVFTGNLAAITTITNPNIYNEVLHLTIFSFNPGVKP
jgi:hypothetical protein